jgi:hypothetical protein
VWHPRPSLPDHTRQHTLLATQTSTVVTTTCLDYLHPHTRTMRPSTASPIYLYACSPNPKSTTNRDERAEPGKILVGGRRNPYMVKPQRRRVFRELTHQLVPPTITLVPRNPRLQYPHAKRAPECSPRTCHRLRAQLRLSHQPRSGGRTNQRADHAEGCVESRDLTSITGKGLGLKASFDAELALLMKRPGHALVCYVVVRIFGMYDGVTVPAPSLAAMLYQIGTTVF